MYNGSSRISSAAGAGATVSVPFSYTLSFNKPLTYTVSATNLPPGLSYNAATQTITGTPTVAGTFATRLSAANSQGYPTSGYLTFNVVPGPTAPPVISSAAGAAGAPGAAFTYTLTAANLPTSFGASSLPAGLTLDPSTGILSGRPAAAGTFSIPVSATNAVGTSNATLTLTVAAAAPSLAADSLTAAATVGVKTLVYRIAETNLPTSYDASDLPPGLSVDTASGAISGTPATAGTYQTTVSAANAYGSVSAVITFTISNALTPPILSTSLAATLTGSVGASFSASLSASGSSVSYVVSTLPPGLYFNTGTGPIFGAPSAAGSYTVNVSAANAAGSDSVVLTLLIASAPASPVFSGAMVDSKRGVGGDAGTVFSQAK